MVQRKKPTTPKPEDEPAYILQKVSDLFVLPGYAVDLATARADRRNYPERDQGKVRICRLEPVKKGRP